MIENKLIDNSYRIRLLRICYRRILNYSKKNLGVERDKVQIYYGLWIIFAISTAIRIIFDRRFLKIIDERNISIETFEDACSFVKAIDDPEFYNRRQSIKNSYKKQTSAVPQIIDMHVRQIVKEICFLSKINIDKKNYDLLVSSLNACASGDLFSFEKSNRINEKSKPDMQSVGNNMFANIYRWEHRDKAYVYQHGLQQYVMMSYHPHDLYVQRSLIPVYYLKWLYNNNDVSMYPRAKFRVNWKVILRSVRMFVSRCYYSRALGKVEKSITLIDYNVSEGQYPWSVRDDIAQLREVMLRTFSSSRLSGFETLWKARHELNKDLEHRLKCRDIKIIKTYSDRRIAGTLFIVPYVSTAIYELALSGAKFVIFLDARLQMSRLTDVGQRFMRVSGLSAVVASTEEELLTKILTLSDDNQLFRFKKIRMNLLRMTFFN